MRRKLSALDRATFMGGFSMMQAGLELGALGFLEFENRSTGLQELPGVAFSSFERIYLPTTCRSETQDFQPSSLQHGLREHLRGSAVNG